MTLLSMIQKPIIYRYFSIVPHTKKMVVWRFFVRVNYRLTVAMRASMEVRSPASALIVRSSISSET